MAVEKRSSGGAKTRAVSQWDKWPQVTLAGRRFYQIPKKEWNAMFSSSFKNMPGWEEPDDGEPGETVLFPVHVRDDHLEFPAAPEPEVVGHWAKAGIASHVIAGDPFDTAINMLKIVEGKGVVEDDGGKGFSACQLQVFNEMDWYGEVWQVLIEHKWLVPYGDLSDDLARQLEEVAPGTIKAAKKGYRENWSSHALEIAAIFLCPPLSRLWYAANLMSLYYCHQDDLRFGYLLAEYRLRLRWEQPALRYEQIAEGNRENGKRGGQGTAADRRRRILNELADENSKMFTKVLPGMAVRRAKQLALQHDRDTGENLFQRGGQLLSDNWFDDWFTDYCTGAQ